jgi:hypothetical protein
MFIGGVNKPFPVMAGENVIVLPTLSIIFHNGLSYSQP